MGQQTVQIDYMMSKLRQKLTWFQVQWTPQSLLENNLNARVLSNSIAKALSETQSVGDQLTNDSVRNNVVGLVL